VPPLGRREAWLLFGLTAVALALRWPWLGRSIWFDEACMSTQRIGTWPQLVATLYVDIHPPLFLTGMFGWNSLFGDSELSMRTVPLLCCLSSIPLGFVIGRRFVGDAAAWLATVLLVLSPVHIWYSAEARLYAPMLLTSLIAVGTFHRLLEGGAARWVFVLHVVNAALMLALHYYLAVLVLLLAALALGARWVVRTEPAAAAARRVVLTHGLLLMLLGAFVLVKRAFGHFETSQSYLRELTFGELGRLFAHWFWTGGTLGAADSALVRGVGVAAVGIGAAAALLGIAVLVQDRQLRPRGPLALVYALTIPAFLMLMPLCGLGNTYIERSTLPSLPFFLWIAAAGVLAVRPPRLRVAAVGIVLALAVAQTVALSVFDDRWTVYKPNPDWRAAARYLGAEIEAGAAGRPVFTTMPNPRPLSYYDARIQDAKAMSPAGRPEEIGRRVGERLGAGVGAYAERTFVAFEAHKRALLEAAALRVFPAGDGTLASLRLDERGRDEVFYLVRNHWHPSDDPAIGPLLAGGEVEVLDARVFDGISVHKVRSRRR
jgi:hypothetical protein